MLTQMLAIAHRAHTHRSFGNPPVSDGQKVKVKVNEVGDWLNRFRFALGPDALSVGSQVAVTRWRTKETIW